MITRKDMVAKEDYSDVFLPEIFSSKTGGILFHA